MVDLPQVVANYDTLVGVALGAGLTYAFGALSRRHQEKREDATRWYQVRLEAYEEPIKAFFGSLIVQGGGPKEDEHDEIFQAVLSAASMTRLVGSNDVMEAVVSPMQESTRSLKHDSDDSQFHEVLTKFEEAARKDLGHPLP